MKKNKTNRLDLKRCYRSPEELKHTEMIKATPEDYSELIIALDKKYIECEETEKDINKLRVKLEILKNEYETLKLMLDECHGVLLDKYKCSCCGCKEFRKVITNDGRTMIKCECCGKLIEE